MKPLTAVSPLALVVVLVALAGCGSHGARPPASTSAHTPAAVPAAPRGRLIVFFRRSIGVDPLASYFKLYSSGEGIATVVYGGVEGPRVHHFALQPAQVARVEALLAHTRLHDTSLANPSQYTYWVITDQGAYRLRQGAVPRPAAPLLHALNAIAEANHLD